MNKFFNEKGYKVLNFPKDLKKQITLDIKKIILNKLCISNIKNFKDLSTIIIKKKDNNFIKLFGSVPSRYLSETIANKVNDWVSKNKIANNKTNSLHYLTKNDLVVRADLKPDHYCVYFRCMKPSKKNNIISFPHRDYDFWRVTTSKTIPKLPFKIKNRYKLWIPIWNCNKQNSLRMVSTSHKKKIKVDYFKFNKTLKPKISLKDKNLNNLPIIQPIKNFNRECILFHDKIVHFAPPNLTNKIRLSVEFTIVTK